MRRVCGSCRVASVARAALAVIQRDPAGAVASVLQQADFVRTYRGFAVRA